jgi:hypothetical protein
LMGVVSRPWQVREERCKNRGSHLHMSAIIFLTTLSEGAEGQDLNLEFNRN